MKNTILIILLLSLFSCKNDSSNQLPLSTNENGSFDLKYAKGFSIDNQGDFKILNITNPWPNADKTYSYVLITREAAAKTTFMRDQYDGIILIPIKSIVVTSTTHIPALELLEEEDKLIGFPGTDYISSEKTRALIDNNSVRELGKNEDLNTEVLLELNPKLVVGFAVDGTNKTFNTIKKANIPVIYNGDWTEASPLAKAEWIKFFGALFNKDTQANTIFNRIEKDYLEAKKLALKAQNKPTILAGAMHKDIWYLPNGKSSEAQIMEDAYTAYLWKDTQGAGSIALNFENVLDKAQDADLWLSPSYYTSLEQLEKASAHYTKFEAFKNKNIYSFSNTTGKTGGVLYYELGTARPDLVLKDIIKICHPELLEDYNPYFFKQLQ